MAATPIDAVECRPRAASAPVAKKSLPREQPPEPARVAQRAGAFVQTDVHIQAPVRSARIVHEIENCTLTEPDRRAHRAAAAEDRRTPEVCVQADETTHRRA